MHALRVIAKIPEMFFEKQCTVQELGNVFRTLESQENIFVYSERCD